MKTKKELINYLIGIAKLYDVRVIWDNTMSGGTFNSPNKIIIGTNDNLEYIASTFFHELSHYLNYIDGDFPIFHRENNLPKALKDAGYNLYSGADYCLVAEIYTDKRGKKLMKKFLPKFKYISWYKNDKYCRGFMAGWLIVGWY